MNVVAFHSSQLRTAMLVLLAVVAAVIVSAWFLLPPAIAIVVDGAVEGWRRR